MVSRKRGGTGDGFVEPGVEEFMTVCRLCGSTALVSQLSNPSSTISLSPVPESRDAGRRYFCPCVMRRVFEDMGRTTCVMEDLREAIVSEPDRLRLDQVEVRESSVVDSFPSDVRGAMCGKVLCISDDRAVGSSTRGNLLFGLLRRSRRIMVKRKMACASVDIPQRMKATVRRLLVEAPRLWLGNSALLISIHTYVARVTAVLSKHKIPAVSERRLHHQPRNCPSCERFRYLICLYTNRTKDPKPKPPRAAATTAGAASWESWRTRALAKDTVNVRVAVLAKIVTAPKMGAAMRGIFMAKNCQRYQN